MNETETREYAISLTRGTSLRITLDDLQGYVVIHHTQPDTQSLIVVSTSDDSCAETAFYPSTPREEVL
jgi:hypothetical protein